MQRVTSTGNVPFDHCLVLTVHFVVGKQRHDVHDSPWFVARYESQECLDRCIEMGHQVEALKYIVQHSLHNNYCVKGVSWQSCSRERARSMVSETQHVFIFNREVSTVLTVSSDTKGKAEEENDEE